jgi:hypothetical protein
MAEFHDEQTLFKVREALSGNHGDGIQLADDVVTDLIRRMQNAGIIFREFTPTVPQLEVEPVDDNGEYAPLRKEEYLRITALEAAINSAARGAGDVEAITARADLFVEYIKNGSEMFVAYTKGDTNG